MASSQSDRYQFDDAIRAAGDLDRLLEGEDTRSPYPEDARHWEAVYKELSDFKQNLLATARANAGSVEPDGQPEVSRDLTIMTAELNRLRSRLEYWTRRRRELEA
jgi:hypothetical protein